MASPRRRNEGLHSGNKACFRRPLVRTKEIIDTPIIPLTDVTVLLFDQSLFEQLRRRASRRLASVRNHPATTNVRDPLSFTYFVRAARFVIELGKYLENR